VEKDIHTELIWGLSSQEVAERIRTNGYNELPSAKKRNVVRILLSVLKEPMLLLLLGSGVIYLLIGKAEDAYMLLTFVVVVIGITFYQERKTEHALDALKNLSSPRALVIRDGKQIRIAGREVVVGDYIILREGDRVPSDATMIESTNLLIDESLLTGESVPVRKIEWDHKAKLTRPGGEDLPFIFSGTLVTGGRGVACVTTTGMQTEIGKIGKSLDSIEEEDSLLQKEMGGIIRIFAVAGIILCALVVVVYGATRGNWLEGFLLGLTLSMAMLPEEFSVVLLVFMTLGAWRMASRSVLTRKTPSLETLGAVTVLCVDKTGTITMNKMQLDGMVESHSYFDVQKNKHLPEALHPLAEYAVLSSQKDPFDPIEKEIKLKGDMLLADTEHIHHNWHLVREYPLSKELLAVSHVWESPNKSSYVIAAKGAPETIIDLCHLQGSESQKIQEDIKIMSGKGLRVIGVAKALFEKKSLPAIQHDFPFEFVGLLGFADPVRSTVKQSVAECYGAGVRVIMITGDYSGTAQYIADEIGLKNADKYITGQQLADMTPQELQKRIREVNIFARVVPEQKLMIVNALKANGEIVAMTGDGVNDAPALKSSHIGIAMGERGTDVARETADLVLLNDDFSSITQAVRLGRRIFDNLQKAIAYIFAVHLPIAGMSLLPVLFRLPTVLFPAHIAFLELIIDPACSIVFEAEKEEKNVMLRPPRDLKKPLFDRSTFLLSLLQGVSILLSVIAIYLFTLSKNGGENEARSIAFVTIVLGNLVLIVTNLSKTENVLQILQNKNKSLYYVLAGTILFLAMVLYVPFLRNLFHFSLLHSNDIMLGVGLALLNLLWFESLKKIRARTPIIPV